MGKRDYKVENFTKMALLILLRLLWLLEFTEEEGSTKYKPSTNPVSESEDIAEPENGDQ